MLRLMRASYLWLVALAACSRPVAIPATGDTFITNASAEPFYVKDNVPFEIVYTQIGAEPASVTYEIGGREFDCTPEDRGGGRRACVHDGVTRDAVQQGQSIIALRATDEDGKSSIATTEVVFDFDCPRFLSLAIDRTIASPGDVVALTMETSEPLGGTPIVTRLGRDWSPVMGEGTSYSVLHDVTGQDPSELSMVLVRIRDRAGNTSTDCGIDGEVPFAVDHMPPTADARGVVLVRDAPGAAARISALPGTFGDDVGIDHIRVLDETGEVLIAQVSAAEDGSLRDTNIGTTTGSRVQLEVEDRFGRTSPRITIRERWRVSVGQGATPGASIRTAVRYTPAPPVTSSMRNRTFEFAPDVAAADTRTAIVRASVGFEKVGDLPSRYEDTNLMMSAYDNVGKTIVAVGGYDGDQYVFFDEVVDETLLLAWDEREGRYLTEQGPPLSYEDPNLPFPRYGPQMAFDGNGCGVIVGGDARTEEFRFVVVGDVWQICHGPGGYTWERINIAPPVPDFRKYTPITWDPINERYVMISGSELSETRVLFLEPGTDANSWRWVVLNPLPSNFNGRSDHVLYFDPISEAIVTGLGGVSPIGNGEQLLYWSYIRGQWTATQIPLSLQFRFDFGAAYDLARKRLALWGGSYDTAREPPREEVWYLVGSSTSAADRWRSATVDHPVPRQNPTMVYDSDREVTVMFGGVRSIDDVRVPPEVHQLISEPSYPYLQANADLAASRPKGIETLHLDIRASGLGDADGVGPGRARGFGVRVMLWDHDARAWTEVAVSAGAADGGIETLSIDVVDNPGRFVSPDGRVPITVVPSRPTTEGVNGRLEVDQIDGYLDLRAGVTLP